MSPHIKAPGSAPESSFVSCLRKFDLLFGKSFSFKINGKESYNSAFGGFSTILLIIAFFVFAYMYCKELWELKKPDFLSYPVLDLKDTTIEFDKTNHFVAYDIEEFRKMDLLETYRYLYFTSYYEYKDKVNNITYDVEVEILNPCDESNVNKTVLQYEPNIANSVCLNLTNKKLGSNQNWEAKLKIAVAKCNKVIEAGLGIKCANRSELEAFLPNKMMRMYVHDEETLVDPINHDEPITHNIRTQEFYLQIDQSYSLFDYYRVVDFSSNDGVLFDHWDNKTLFEHGQATSVSMPLTDNVYAQHVLKVPAKKIIYNRKYTTISLVLAEIGGILSLIYNVFTVVISILIEPKYNKFILDQLTNSYIEEVEEENELEIDKTELKRCSTVGRVKRKYINEIKQSNIKKSVELKSVQDLENNTINDEENSKKVESKDNYKEKLENKEKLEKDTKLEKAENKTKVEITYCKMFRYIYLNFCSGSKKNKNNIPVLVMNEVIDRANAYINKRSDVLNLFKHYDEFEIMKKLIFNSNQSFMLRNLKERTINTKFRVDQLIEEDEVEEELNYHHNEEEDLNIKKLARYLKKKKHSANDKILYDNLDLGIKMRIEEVEGRDKD